ncbi:uncharacterized protein LOC128735934 [Sabethes cyaneus]|uniref:uncharacterized protein LOC128735934 n=1 Tax=Sabethes cyaneus TaxID=53552 RepID=UPI00237E8538|nr:uncharacterized protein LOC128735934 [Sabethes cyaneus]
MVEKKALNVYMKTKSTEIRKLDSMKMKKIEDITPQPEWVENTTNVDLPDYLVRSLRLGPNFNIQNKTSIPYVRFIADVETAIQKKPDADNIRTEISTIISNHINYKNQPRTKENDWIHKDIVKSRKFLKENPDLYVTKADKGNKVVLISAQEYHQKMTELVNDTEVYKPINENPTNRTLRKLNTIIQSWWENKHIDTHTKNKLKVFNCHPPRIYGLPKIHKNGRPLRPVVSTIGSATYRMAQYLAGILGHLVGKTEHHIRNSFDFADEISRFRVPDGTVMYSLDVVSLYTNIPTDKVYEYVEEKWSELQRYTTIPFESFKIAMKCVLEASFFQYNNMFFMQIYGLPIGSPLSPVVANIVMEKLEINTLAALKQQGIEIGMYKRYVDDCLVVGKEDEIDTVLREFNQFSNTIKFTFEKETESSLRFLDLTLRRNKEKIEKMWYPKQKNGRYLDFMSESPHSHKINTITALLDRALKLTDPENREQSILVAVNTLRKNNYPEHLIKHILKNRVHLMYNTLKSNSDEEKTTKYISLPYIPCLSEKVAKALRKHDITVAHKPNDKMKDVLFAKLKDKIPVMQQTNVIYSVPCGVCVNNVYIGQTSQTLEKRLQQHMNSIRTRTSMTGLTQHTVEQGHVFKFSDTSILERVSNEANRLTAETLHIKLREGNTVNLQRDAMSFSSVYNGILCKLRTATLCSNNAGE